jgi:raffinose/stachyose/melibiose transport system substrate-binding protein
MKKIVGCIVFVALAFSVLAGCGSNEKESKGVNSTDNSSKVVTIEFFNQKREIEDVMKDLITKFENENPGIKIKQNIVPDPTTVLQSRIASGDTPDIFTDWPNGSFVLRVKNGVVAELTGDSYLSNAQDQARELFKIDGKEYSLPLSYNTVGVLYNKGIFEKLNLTIPKTFDELLAVAEKIKANDITPFIVEGKEVESILREWYTLLPSMSDYDQFVKDTAAGNLNIDQRKDNLDKISNKFTKLVSFAQNDVMGTGSDQARNDFAAEKAAMLITGSWVIPVVKSSNPELSFAMFPMPGDTEDSTFASAFPGDFALHISSTTKHPEEARKFLQFMSSPENATIYTEKTGAISAINSVDIVSPELSYQYEFLKSGKYKLNTDANWTVNTGNSIGAALQRFIIEKDQELFLKDMDAAIKTGQQ